MEGCHGADDGGGGGGGGGPRDARCSAAARRSTRAAQADGCPRRFTSASARAAVQQLGMF